VTFDRPNLHMNIEAKVDRSQGLLQYWAFLVILVAMLPSFYWIANDHHAWPWDQSWYGEVSVDLWFKLTHHISEWFPAMATAFGSKSPGIAWFGQLFVPLERVFGSIEEVLLLSVVATQIGSMVLFCKLTEEFAPGRRLVTAAGVLLFAGAPLFVAMSHQYFPEPLQLLGVTYFYYLAATGHRMKRETLLGNLLVATSIALLAKITSPIYCALPGLIAVSALFEKRKSKSEVSSNGAYWRWLWLFAGVILCVACAVWYAKNLPALRETLRRQTSPEFMLDYGHAGTLFQKLPFWLHALQWSFQLPWVILGQLVLIGAGAALATIRGGEKRMDPRQTGEWRFNLLTISSVIHIIVVLALCSLNYNEETRYLLPLLPAIATVNIWLLCKIRHPWILAGVIILLSAQWIAVCAQALGLAHLDQRTCSYWVIPFDKNRRQAEEIVRIAQKTASSTGASRYNIVGIELPWLNANTLSFFAAKAELETGRRNYYTGLGYGAKDLDAAWKRMNDLKNDYFISLEEADQPLTANFLNQVSIPALRRIRDDPDFVSVPFPSDLGVALFRRKTENAPPPPGKAAQ
jgi:hypothetical protein